MLFSRPASTGALAVAFIGSLTLALGWDAAASTQVVLAIVLLAFLAWVNIVGVVWGGRLQLLTTLIKAGFLAVVTLLPLLLGPFVEQAWTLSNYVRPLRLGSRRFRRRSERCCWPFSGLTMAGTGWLLGGGGAPAAADIPLALFAGVGILIVLYVGANVAYHGVLSMAQMQAAGNHAAEEMLRQLLGRVGLTSMSIVIMCSTFGALNCNLLYAPRVTFAMGRDGVFFRELGRVHAHYRTPAAAIALLAAMAALPGGGRGVGQASGPERRSPTRSRGIGSPHRGQPAGRVHF